MTVSPPVNQDQVERKVASLQASPFSPRQLRRACQSVLARQEPLRDAIVLREAERLAELESPESHQAWRTTREAVRQSVREHVYFLWIEPCAAFGTNGDTLILEAPDRVRAWTARRYSHLIEEALQQHSDFKKVQFVSSGGEG